MICFSLSCKNGHEFDGWFRNGADFDTQKERGLVACPECATSSVMKQLMAPAVSTSRKQEKVALAAGRQQRKVLSELKKLAEKLRENSDYVGDKFAEEARRIHFGEVEGRSIYGEATAEEATSLIEDGVEFLPIPVLPDDRN